MLSDCQPLRRVAVVSGLWTWHGVDDCAGSGPGQIGIGRQAEPSEAVQVGGTNARPCRPYCALQPAPPSPGQPSADSTVQYRFNSSSNINKARLGAANLVYFSLAWWWCIYRLVEHSRHRSSSAVRALARWTYRLHFGRQSQSRWPTIGAC